MSESEPTYENVTNITNSNLLLPDRSNIKFTSVNSNLGSNLSKNENEPMVKQFTDGCYLMNRLGVSDREFNAGNCLLVSKETPTEESVYNNEEVLSGESLPNNEETPSEETLFNLYYPSGWKLTNYFNSIIVETDVTNEKDEIISKLQHEYTESLSNVAPYEIKHNQTIDGNLYYMRFIFTDTKNNMHYSLFELEEGFGNLCYDACGNSIISIKSSNISHKTDNNKYITNNLTSTTSIQKSKLIKNNYLNMVGYNIAHNIFSSQSCSSNNRFYSIHSLYVPYKDDTTTMVLGFDKNTVNDYIITYSQDFQNEKLETYVLYYGNIVYKDKSYFAKTKYSKFSASCIHFHIDNIQVYDGTTPITEVSFTYKLTIFYLDSYNSSTKKEIEEYSKFGSIDFIYELPDKSNIITGIMLEIIPDTTEKTIATQLSIKLENPNLNVWDFNEIGTKFVDKEKVKLYIPRKVEA